MAVIVETTDIPIACNPKVFTKDELESHVSVSLDVIFRLPKHRHELVDGFVFEYRGNEEQFLKVARFVYKEPRCCPWVSFGLEQQGHLLWEGARQSSGDYRQAEGHLWLLTD